VVNLETEKYELYGGGIIYQGLYAIRRKSDDLLTDWFTWPEELTEIVECEDHVFDDYCEGEYCYG